MQQNVDLTEASERVAVLDQFPFEDDQPNIEAPSLSVLYDSYVDYNFADRNAFDTRWTEETHAIAQLVRYLLGNVNRLYRWEISREISTPFLFLFFSTTYPRYLRICIDSILVVLSLLFRSDYL